MKQSKAKSSQMRYSEKLGYPRLAVYRVQSIELIRHT